MPRSRRADPPPGRRGRFRILCAWLTLVLALTWRVAEADDVPRITPRVTDKCPVCGMFVAKYPDFIAAVVYRDGATVLFDGAKDMFKYLLNPRVYAPARTASDIAFVLVTDYYGLARIDGRTAWYVIGSDVTGPMGRELIPFGREGEAREFMHDHSGRRLLRFGEVTVEVLKGLD